MRTTMRTHAIKPWTDLVKLHPDVEAGNLPESVFAIDVGAIAEGSPEVPAVNREPDAFFRATYLTTDLRKLLQEVLSPLAGQGDFNRVLKLRTPFGGGKSHTLTALLHAARKREALNILPEATGLTDPGKVDVAVFDGEKSDARDGKTLPNGRRIQTMLGWIAWQFGESKFKLVENHDRDRVSPGGDVIRQLLAGGPKLILLDEVLNYMERASAVAVQESTLHRQAKDFFQNLTVEVAGSKTAAMVYLLQWRARESLGNVALLQEIDKLASRVDQFREPVSGDEALHVLHRCLLGEAPSKSIAQEVAESYGKVVIVMQMSHAENLAARQHAEEEGLALVNRIKAAYTFNHHPKSTSNPAAFPLSPAASPVEVSLRLVKREVKARAGPRWSLSNSKPPATRFSKPSSPLQTWPTNPTAGRSQSKSRAPAKAVSSHRGCGMPLRSHSTKRSTHSKLSKPCKRGIEQKSREFPEEGSEPYTKA